MADPRQVPADQLGAFMEQLNATKALARAAHQKVWEEWGNEGTAPPEWTPQNREDTSNRSLQQVARSTSFDAQSLVRVDRILDGEERVIAAGNAIRVDLAERYGRGSGEGKAVITTVRLIHVSERPTEQLAIPRHDVLSAMDSWIIMAGMRELEVKTARGPELRLYAGKHFAKAASRELSR